MTQKKDLGKSGMGCISDIGAAYTAGLWIAIQVINCSDSVTNY